MSLSASKGTRKKESSVGRRSRKSGGRWSGKIDMKVKLERSRQSARECRARKKLRYQYLEELVAHREQAVLMLRKELDVYKIWCKEVDEGNIPEGLKKLANEADEDDVEEPAE